MLFCSNFPTYLVFLCAFLKLPNVVVLKKNQDNFVLIPVLMFNIEFVLAFFRVFFYAPDFLSEAKYYPTPILDGDVN